MLTESLELALLIVVGFFSGAINAVAGGGSLLVFPALLATGMPPLVANVTNSVAQGPGFVGAAVSQRADLKDSRKRLWLTTGAAAVGSAIGCVLLLVLPGSVFDAVVPALVGLSAVLMAFQTTIRRWMGSPEAGGSDRLVLLTIGIFLASIYGGYFGGARSVILIAVLVLAASDVMRRLNALKSWLGMVGSAVTLVVYALVAPVDWIAVLTLVPTTVLGGFVGGKLAQRLPANFLRYLVVVIAAAVAVYLVVD
ncbi:sulfite exporter TauE/SafE family protein [Saccharopolyspora sp. CA-218241]|uniref:sulfite exporter TauE/SafE family protein n=1 Tax=Saccharopolyspora sp. CA-218241 TaxID=3240027 RepID=UPI003D95A4F4